MQHCHNCGRKVGKQSAQQIVDEIMKLQPGSKLQLLAPIVVNRKGEHKDLLVDAQRRGYSRARIDGKVRSLEDSITLDKKSKHDIELIIDRLVLKGDLKARLTDSVESALKEGKGVLIVTDETGSRTADRTMSELNACHHCGLSFPELVPASFSFNNPLGMCTECNRPRHPARDGPGPHRPDKTRSIREGAVEVWASGMATGEGWTADLVDTLSRAFGIDLDTVWKSCRSERERDIVLYGSQGKSFTMKWGDARWKMEWEGLVNKLMRSFNSTTSESMKQYYMKFFSDKPCPTCGGERLRPESRSVKVHGKTLVELSHFTITEAQLDFLDAAAADDQ